MPLPYEGSFTFSGRDVWLSEFRLPPGHPDWNTARATTDHAFLIAFPRTTVAIRHEGRDEVVADALSAVVYAPGQPYRRRLISATGDDCTILAASRTLIADVSRSFDPDADPETLRVPFCAADVERSSHASLERIRACIAGGLIADVEAIEEELYWLLSHVVSNGYAATNGHRRSGAGRHAALADAVREVLGRDLSAAHSLTELARLLFVSPFHLVRTFRSITGRPIHAYRTELRLRASLPLIADGVRLADVAQQLGFASHAHLTDRFVRAYGTSPATWRKTSRFMEAGAGRTFIA